MVKIKGAFAPFKVFIMKEWSLIIIIAILSIYSQVSAQNWEEGYDANTEVAIKGKIVEVIHRQHGPVIIPQ